MQSTAQNSTSKSSQKNKTSVVKLTPSQLVQKQLSGNISEDFHQKSKITKFLNLADYSIYTDTNVPIDEPLFEAIPPIIQFIDYEPLQSKQKLLKLRNKDKVARRVKILPPDSRLFQVIPAPTNTVKRRQSQEKFKEKEEYDQLYSGNKVAPSLEANFYIKFSPEAKIDYYYDLTVITEREQFIIPIYAVGKRAMIDFPDFLDFGKCPVKYITEKPIIIRNLGEKTTKWFLKLPQGFDADKKEGVLEYGKNEQIVVQFFPHEIKTFKSEAVLSYDKLEAYIPLMGIANNSSVYLSKYYINMEDAYIGLQTQQTLQIINKSEVKVDFEWRAFATEKEEQEKKNRLRQQLEEEEAEERMLLKEIVNNEAIHEEFEIEDHDDSDEEDKDEKAILLKRQKKAELMLARKYKNIRKAIEDDLLLFQDDIFSIEPQQGQIWPNSEMTITLTFVPKGALQYSCIAFCNISCSEERLALNLAGEGIGPKAFLSQTDLPIGNKNVNEKERYQITIENRGEIECKFELLPNERNFGKMFKFLVTKGTLGVGTRQTIEIEFCSTIPGEFKETFRFRLEGSTDLLSLTCFGHVTAPKFSFDTDQINFGKVSYSFPVERKIRLTNQSNVSFWYNLRIPGDGKQTLHKEFEINPQRDQIDKGQEKDIIITFIPKSCKKYEMVMVVDIEGVGQDMYSLPIKAESEVPVVEIKPKDTLNFDEIFLRDPDTRGITIINNSTLKAKFIVLPQNDESKALATYKVDVESDTIEPGKDVTIKVTLMTMKLREITLPLSISIVGANNGLPYVINIVANSIGPRVEVIGDKEIDFGQCDVLKDYSKKITIKNNSRIVADFHAFTKNKNSVFKPIEKKGVLQPDEQKEIEVICCCDDATKFADILHFVIKEGMDIDIVLKSKGIGSTIFCKEDLNLINFGVCHTYKQFSREIFVENKGRKDQKLTWQRKKPATKKNQEKDDGKKGGNAQNAKDSEPVEDPDIFQIIPETIVLPKKNGIMFQFRGFSTKREKIQELFSLQCSGLQERKNETLFNTVIQGEFIQPTLVFSEKNLYFKYTWEKNVPFLPISKNLELTCGSQQPVNFNLKVQPPFSINRENFDLLPGKSSTVRVDFDPSHKSNRVSGEQAGKITVVHHEHPHRQYVDLIGEVCFPNIKLDSTLINFGSILNDTQKKIVINMQNISEMAIYYEWTFIEEELVQSNVLQQDLEKHSNSSRASLRQDQKTIPINEVFDILPLSGNLKVNETEQVEFVYNAFGGQRFKTTAICKVEGGPNYEVTLIGDSSLLTYHLSTYHIEFNDVRFCDWVSRDFLIENTGKVTFEFKILYHQVKSKSYLNCTPSSGKILGGEKQKITLRMCPVMPNEFKEIVNVQVGYFEPEPITITGKGYYPAILLDVPRGENPSFQERFDQEFKKKKLERENTLKRQQLMAKAQGGDKKQQVGAGVKSLEQIQSEVEKELDRIIYCEMISAAIEEKEKEKLYTNPDKIEKDSRDDNLKDKNLPEVQLNRTMTAGSKINVGVETKLYDKINLSNYIVDFGNVVINNIRKESFKIINVGQTPIDFQFDTRQCRSQGYSILPERTTKLVPGDEQEIFVSYQAKKNMKFGKTKTLLPLEIKNGAKYQIELLANITIPEIIMENVVDDCVDFGKVLCGQRKTVYVRLINEKEIDCEWNLSIKQDLTVDKKKEPCKFEFLPINGVIQSGNKQIVSITFSPSYEKDYNHKFVININQNPKPFPIFCKGTGTSINLVFNPNQCVIGPVLPYDNFAHCILELKNPSDYDTEVYSVDFDKLYIEEEQILNEYEEFEANSQLFLQVREPGQQIWDFIKKSVDKKKQRDAILQKLSAIDLPEEEKNKLQRELTVLQSVERKVEFPNKVEDDVKHHVIIYGPQGVGKTHLAQQLQLQHKRSILNLATVVDWCLENNTNGGKKARKFLQDKEIERDNIDQERQKLLKKAGKKAPELEQKWGPINQEQFQYLSEDILEECIREAMSTEEANAGVMIDGLASKYYPNELFGLKVLLKAIGNQSVQFVLIRPQTDEHGLELWKMIEWDGMEQKLEENQAQNEKKDDNQGKKKQKPKKGGKDDKKEELKEDPKDKNKKKDVKKTQKKENEKGSQGTGSQAVGNEQQENQDEIQNEQNNTLFDIFEPKEFSSNESKAQWEKLVFDMERIMTNQFKEKLELPKIYDPVFEENKKEEKKATKKGKEVVEEVQEDVEEVIDYTNILHKGKRSFTPIPIHYNLNQLVKTGLQVIPTPVYPDPNTLPVPQPIFHHVVTKPSTYVNRKKIDLSSNTMKYFQILTPKDNMYAPEEEKQVVKQEEAEKTKTEENIQQSLEGEEGIKKTTQENNEEQPPIVEKPKEEEKKQEKKIIKPKRKQQQKQDVKEKEDLTPKITFTQNDLVSDKSRWIIPSKRTLYLVVKFFTKVVGDFDGKLDFECSFSLKKYTVELQGIADFPQISQLPKNLYWSVKRLRPPQPPESYLSKVFVTSEGQFDFGPLLIGKNPDKRNESDLRKINSITFRISNQGKFDTSLEFNLLSTVMENNKEYKKGIFWFEPEKLQIQKNDVPQEIRVWCIPDEARKFRDDLIIMIKDNPTPVILPMIALGARPVVVILEGEHVKFDRLLLGQKSRKEIRLKNDGCIPCLWKLLNAENLPEEYDLNKFTNGRLEPNEEATIVIEFMAKKQQKYNNQITLEVQDVENMQIKQDPKIIPIDAEAFDITVDIKFPDNNNNNMLPFGFVKVGEIKDQYFTVKNIGLYLVQLSFVFKKKSVNKDCFTIFPEKLELEKDQEKQILVRFCSERELELKTSRENAEITMEILEGKSLELFKQISINVDVNAVFSQYAIVPMKNINFGPIQFNDSRTLTFEIKNEGQFEFNYTIFDYFNEDFRNELMETQKEEKRLRKEAAKALDQQQQQQGKDSKKGKKDEKKPEKKAPGKPGKGKDLDPTTMLRVGQFAINPCNGSILPDSSATIEITFAGSGSNLLEKKLAIDISGRNPTDQEKGILYELVGESCVPGILCDAFEQIFEEQIIVPNQMSSQNITSMISSRVFYYEEKMFNFGSLVSSKHPDGVYEKFKIINPNKIPCNVKFDVRKRNPNSTENFAFEIATKTAKIPPHESTYVKVYFKPTIMAQYSGIFEAIVEQGEQNPKTHKLVFDIRGEGAMPTLKLEKPKEYFNDSTVLLKFPKVRIGKDLIQQIILKNDGQVPATVKFDLTTNENFRFIDQNSLTLTPKTYATFNIEFKPREPGVKQWQIAYQTLLNPYEITKIMVQGEGFYEDIVFEDLPNELEDEVNLGDCILNQEKKLTFAVKNNSSEPIRFNWNTQGCEDFQLVPRNGHLKGKSSKNITLIFKSKMSIQHKKFGLILETKQIKQQGSADDFIDWDDSMYNIRYVTQTEFDWWERKKEEEKERRMEEERNLAGQKKGAKKQDKKQAKKEETKDDKPPLPQPGEEANKPLEEAIPEPDHQQIDKTDKNVQLKVSAVADYARYEVATREIFFKSTLMYTSRVHQFDVKNTSLININYKCRIIKYENEDHQNAQIDPGYFYVSPKDGTLAPNCNQPFTVRFSPTEVHQDNERYLLISIENMEPKAEPLVIELDGEAERPMCHFELPPSKYREKKPDIDSSFNIIEFVSLGMKVKNTKRFYVVNPTSGGYEFEWKKKEEDKLPPTANNQYESFFKCLIQKGSCLSGKKFEMIFEYTPDQVGTHEAYYTFEVPMHDISINFMLVGTVIEPNVFFNVGKVDFGPLLIGGKNKETVKLKNLEEVPISFNFDKASIQGESDYGNSLIVFPLSGQIKPNSEIAIEITFQPQSEVKYNYNLLCNMKRKSRPISLNIKGTGYILDHSVYYGQSTSPLDYLVPFVVDFGDIYINEKRSRFLEIENRGEFNFDYNIKKSSQITFLQINPENGTAKQKERMKIELKFHPIEQFRFNNKQQLALSITSGPTYIFKLKGSAKKPAIDLSFYQYDFGNCFVFRQPLFITINLEMRNRDTAAMSVETLFEKKPHLNVQLAPGTVIMPLQTETKEKNQVTELNVLQIPITFTPRECKKYEEDITFDINGLHTIDVKIIGEGIPLKLELEKAEDQNIDFGVVRVNKEAFHQCTLVNLSKKVISITFDTDNQLEELKKQFISISPSLEYTINPREKKEITFIFAPKVRLHSFKKEIHYKIVDNKETKKLLNIHGNCHGMELKLLQDTIGFGVVTINSKTTKQLQLSNLGDIGAKYEWDTSICGRYFTISPQKGFLPPNEDTFFQITFHPDVVDNDFNFKNVKCIIQGADEPLCINLLGKCAECPTSNVAHLDFNTIVRTEQKKKVTVKNPTSEACKIKVSVQATLPRFKDYFKGKETLEIPPNGTAEYEIIYAPLTMTVTKEAPQITDATHEGTLFFPLSDGSALLYNLTGISTPPQAEQPTLDVQIKAKVSQTATIPIKNWLKNLQRLTVNWKKDKEDPSIFITGAKTIDIASEATKEYKLSLFGLKTTNSIISVYFTNEKTYEYKFYNIKLTVTPPEPQKKIELQSIVRETVSKIINIDNPLDQDVEIKKEMLTSDNENIQFNPTSFVIPAHSEFGFEVIYRPLLAKDEQSKVTLKSPELGDYVYPLQLKGIAPTTAQRVISLKSQLGSELIQSFKFLNFCKKATQYTCKIEKLGPQGKAISSGPVDPKAKGGPVVQIDFSVDTPSINVPPADSLEGNEVSLNLRYEPSNLGESNAVLILSSLDGGEYQCILNGISTPPQPKGPYKMGGQKPAPVEFKNPFFEAQEFTIRIDNPSFTTGVKSPVKIDGKKALSISINYKAVPGTSANGRLIITIDKSDYPPWIFYLQGD